MPRLPTSIKLHRHSQILEVAFDTVTFHLRAEYLRVFSPSAEVKGHGPGQEVLQLNKENVAITAIEPQGNYAIKLLYSDGHDSGIYTWDYLYELGKSEETLWQDYLAKVDMAKVDAHKRNDGISPLKWIPSDNS